MSPMDIQSRIYTWKRARERFTGFKETAGDDDEDDAAEENRIQEMRNDGLVALTVTESLIDTTSD